VKGLLRPRQRTGPAPPFWTLYCTRLFGTSDRFACQLWRHYDATPTTAWQLDLCSSVPDSPDVWVHRIKHLNELVSPTSLLQASEKLSPATGQRRDPEAVAFDERVLQLIDHTGRWRW
jgi:hypothetical protein